MTDEGIFVCEPPPDKPKRVSRKVHFARDRAKCGRIRPYCFRKNARLYTHDWKKVTCFYCKDAWKQHVNYHKRAREKKTARRRYIKEEGKREGMRTLREAAIAKLLAGVTTVEEVLRVTEEEG